jgi:hypothetical protein
VLYLRAEHVPLKPLEVFGVETIIRPFTRSLVKSEDGESMADPISISIAAHKEYINCLPVRLRVFPDATYWEKGEKALRNYDKAPRGQGELHKDMESVARYAGYR